MFISPFLADPASGGGMVSRMNLACLRGEMEAVQAMALTSKPAGSDFTAIGSPPGTLVTALCNLMLLTGRLTPSALFKFGRTLRTEQPDVVFLDSSSLGWLALLTRILAPRAKLVAFFHNIEFDFQLERSRSEGRRYLLSAIAEYVNEYLTTSMADALLMLTQEDSVRSRQLYSRGADVMTPVCLADQVIEDNALIENASALEAPDSLLFVGSGFFANREAVEFLLTRLAPALKLHGDTRIRVVGSGFGSDEWQGDIPDNVDMLGRVPDLSPLYRSSIAVVAPIFSGAGMKVKVAEALMHGVPVIGTPLALRGYIDNVPNAMHLLPAFSVEEYLCAISVCQLSRSTRSAAARQDYERRFSLVAGKRRIKNILEQLLESSA